MLLKLLSYTSSVCHCRKPHIAIIYTTWSCHCSTTQSGITTFLKILSGLESHSLPWRSPETYAIGTNIHTKLSAYHKACQMLHQPPTGLISFSIHCLLGTPLLHGQSFSMMLLSIIGYSCMWLWQVMSGGLLRATPHCVRAPRRDMCGGVSRNTLAVFMQPR